MKGVPTDQKPPTERICRSCGRDFMGRRPTCEACRSRRAYYAAKARQGDGRTPAKWHRNVKRRTLRLASQTVEPVSLSVVYDRAGGLCCVCGFRIDLSIRWPDPLSLSMEHVVAIVDGGEHSYANVRVSHLGCNLKKGAEDARRRSAIGS